MNKEEFFLNEYKNNRFQVNYNTGIIYSEEFKRPLGSIHKRTGYIVITLYKQKKRFQMFAHRLIWLCYNGSIDKTLQINHLNGIKTDNRLENLELVTCQENIRHAFRTGLMSGKLHSHILNEYYKTHVNVNRKLNSEQVIEIRNLYDTGLYSYRKLGRIFGVDKETIAKIIKKIHYKF